MFGLGYRQHLRSRGTVQGWIHEAAVRWAPPRRRIIYSGGTMPKFFLEIKRPSVNIKDDAQPAFQLRRYGWTAKLPLSSSPISRNSPSMIAGCDQSGESTKAWRTMYLTYKEYAERWDEIAGIFSPCGSEGACSTSMPKRRRGERVRNRSMKLSWRRSNPGVKLAKNLALRNPKLTSLISITPSRLRLIVSSSSVCVRIAASSRPGS